MKSKDRKALQTAASEKLSDATLFIRLGSVLLVKKRWKQARDAFLQSIQSKATAEVWRLVKGVASAMFRAILHRFQGDFRVSEPFPGSAWRFGRGLVWRGLRRAPVG